MMSRLFPDTSRRGTRVDRGLPVMPRSTVRTRRFFSFENFDGSRGVRAPEGYAFNRRGDFVSLKREARRQRARRAA